MPLLPLRGSSMSGMYIGLPVVPHIVYAGGQRNLNLKTITYRIWHRPERGTSLRVCREEPRRIGVVTSTARCGLNVWSLWENCWSRIYKRPLAALRPTTGNLEIQELLNIHTFKHNITSAFWGRERSLPSTCYDPYTHLSHLPLSLNSSYTLAGFGYSWLGPFLKHPQFSQEMFA
jgi:hypothetical protein